MIQREGETMMKKSTLLSLATAVAIAVTTAGTYAAWDTLTDDTTASVSFGTPVTVNVADSYTLTSDADTRTLGETPEATGDVTFTVEDTNSLADTLTLTPTVTEGVGKTDMSAYVDVTIIDKGESGTPALTKSGSSFVDKTLTSTSTTYTVTVTPKSDTASVEALSGKTLDVTLTAELSKATTE